jgi:hypothetical protein
MLFAFNALKASKGVRDHAVSCSQARSWMNDASCACNRDLIILRNVKAALSFQQVEVVHGAGVEARLAIS